MRQGRTGVNLKNKPDKTVYTVQITGEQINLIRSYSLRTEQLWVHCGISEQIRENGDVDRVPFWECYFCHKGSYRDADSIQHKETCVVPLADREFSAMNDQFIQARKKATGSEATA